MMISPDNLASKTIAGIIEDSMRRGWTAAICAASNELRRVSEHAGMPDRNRTLLRNVAMDISELSPEFPGKLGGWENETIRFDTEIERLISPVPWPRDTRWPGCPLRLERAIGWMVTGKGSRRARYVPDTWARIANLTKKDMERVDGLGARGQMWLREKLGSVGLKVAF